MGQFPRTGFLKDVSSPNIIPIIKEIKKFLNFLTVRHVLKMT